MSGAPVTDALIQVCQKAWRVTALCVRRWGQRTSFALLVGALTAPLPPRHFKFRAEEAAQLIRLPEENPWRVSTAIAREVYSRMVSHVDDRGTCWIGVNELAIEVDRDARTVRRAQAALRALGFLASFKRFECDERLPGNFARSNVHVLLLGPELQAASDSRSNALPRRARTAEASPAAKPGAKPVEPAPAPFSAAVEQLNRVTGARCDAAFLAELAAEARCPIPAAISCVDDARVKAFAGIHGGEPQWTRRGTLYRTLASFFLAAARKAPAEAPRVQELVAELEARERQEREQAEAARLALRARQEQRRAGAPIDPALVALNEMLARQTPG